MIRHWRLALIAVVLLGNGCASTGQARSVETSGFLQDLYPRMHKGAEGEALLVYKNREGRSVVGNATKIMLDPVLIYRGQDTQMKGVPQDQAQLMADTFYALIYQELSKDYEMVRQPGPNTLRAQVAIVNMEQSDPVLDIISSIPAPLNVLALGSALKTVAGQTCIYRRGFGRSQGHRCPKRRSVGSIRGPPGRKKAPGCRVVQFLGRRIRCLEVLGRAGEVPVVPGADLTNQLPQTRGLR